MNRRNFLKSLTAVAAANIFLPRAVDAFKWKQRETGVWVLNPAWVTAPYRVDFMYVPGGNPLVEPFVTLRVADERIYHPQTAGWVLHDHYPVRLDVNGRPVPIRLRQNKHLTFSQDDRY